MPTLDQYKTLVAVVESGSFRSASESLHKAQSAVSYSIKSMEDEFELQLFNRDGYRPVLTEAGRAIYQKAREMLLRQQEILQLGEYLSQGKEAEIRLAINGIGPFDQITGVLKAFTGDHPQTRLKLSVENLSGAVERVLDEDADFGLAEISDWNSHLEKTIWTQITLFPVCSRSFMKGLKDKKAIRSEFSGKVQIIVKDSGQHLNKTIGVLDDCDHWVVNDFSAKKQLVIAGLGWGYMPVHQIESELNSKKLVKIEVPFLPVFNIDYYLFKKQNKILKPMARILWDLFETKRQISR